MTEAARQVADAPFDKRCGADMIFRTSDNVDFFLHKPILSLASSFFETMSSLPSTTSSGPDELPVVVHSVPAHEPDDVRPVERFLVGLPDELGCSLRHRSSLC